MRIETVKRHRNCTRPIHFVYKTCEDESPIQFMPFSAYNLRRKKGKAKGKAIQISVCSHQQKRIHEFHSRIASQQLKKFKNSAVVSICVKAMAIIVLADALD